MGCDICGATEDLVKVRNEDREMINLCHACYEAQYEGYEFEEITAWNAEGEEKWEDEEDMDTAEGELLEDDEDAGKEE